MSRNPSTFCVFSYPTAAQYHFRFLPVYITTPYLLSQQTNGIKHIFSCNLYLLFSFYAVGSENIKSYKKERHLLLMQSAEPTNAHLDVDR